MSDGRGRGNDPRHITRAGRSDRAGAREFAATGRRLREERRLAPFIVDPMLKTTPREKWPALAERSELRTCGVLEYLSKVIDERCSSDPKEALELANIAVCAAECVPLDLYPKVVTAQLQAHAWMDVGKALRGVSRNPDALEAFDQAESRLEPYPSLGHDRAIVWLHRALSLQEMGRFTEAAELLSVAKAQFAAHGDQRRAITCAVAEGAALQRQSRFREAREAYLLLFALTELPAVTRAALQRTIGMCSMELGDFAAAEISLEQAEELNESLGQRAEAVKTRAMICRLYIRRGDVAMGVSYLRNVRRDLIKLGLPEEAGLSGLDVVQGLLELGNAEAAETLARRIIEEFTAAGLSARAISALGYLAEAIEAKKASAELATKVRDYIVSLRTAPERDFATET